MKNLLPPIWKPIEDYERYYEISPVGVVRSLRKDILLKTEVMKSGYVRVCLCKDGYQKNFLLHRLVAKAFIPNVENYRCINHKDGNKRNNMVENLEWCSHSMNILHAYRFLGKVTPSKGKNMPEEQKRKVSESMKRYYSSL